MRIFYPAIDQTAVTTAGILILHMNHNDIPLAWYSDHATAFTGTVMTAVAKGLGIRVQTTYGHHPEGNAIVERGWHLWVNLLLYSH